MKAVIFDFDGTIADSANMITEIANVLLEDLGREKLTQEDIQKSREMTIPQLIKYYKVPTAQIPKLAIRIKKMITERIDQLPPVNGMDEVILRLHEQGFVLGILSSNTKSNIISFLRNHGLENQFSFVDAGAGIISKKSRLKQSLRRHKIAAEDCVYIGDEIKDVVAAKSNGVKSIAVNWGLNTANALRKYDPDYIATSAGQIMDFV